MPKKSPPPVKSLFFGGLSGRPKLYLGGVFIGDVKSVEIKTPQVKALKRLKVGGNQVVIEPAALSFEGVTIYPANFMKALGMTLPPDIKRSTHTHLRPVKRPKGKKR